MITAVDGAPVNSASEMVYRMSVAGEREVTIDYARDGDRESVLVSLIQAPENPPREETTLPDRAVLPGLVLVRINPAVMSEFNLPLDSTGVLVKDPGPYGGQVGLRRGDVIRLINGSRVTDPRTAQRALSKSGRFRLAVLRGNRRVVLTFRS